MAVPNPRTWAVGETVTAALMNAEVRDPFSFLLDLPRIKVARSVAFDLDHQEWTSMTWDTEVFKDGITHSNVTNSHRLTVVDPGDYLVVANCTFEADTGGQRRVDLCFNGTTAGVGTRVFASENVEPPTVAASISVAGLQRAAAGDYFHCMVYQSGGLANLDVTTASSFGAVWVGR